MEKREVRLSVRSLVEFIYRSGDLDNRRRTSSEVAMSEGNRVHRMLQKKGGPGYHAEVGLRYHYVTEQYDICLEGRADGIMEDYVPEDYVKLTEHLLRQALAPLPIQILRNAFNHFNRNIISHFTPACRAL